MPSGLCPPDMRCGPAPWSSRRGSHPRHLLLALERPCRIARVETVSPPVHGSAGMDRRRRQAGHRHRYGNQIRPGRLRRMDGCSGCCLGLTAGHASGAPSAPCHQPAPGREFTEPEAGCNGEEEDSTHAQPAEAVQLEKDACCQARKPRRQTHMRTNQIGSRRGGSPWFPCTDRLSEVDMREVCLSERRSNAP